MLTDIRIHLSHDEDEQQAAEHARAKNIEQNYLKNMAAFKRYVPSIHDQLADLSPSAHALFVNKSAQFNIVDYSTGKTMYGIEPQAEIEHQLSLSHFFTSTISNEPIELEQASAPLTAESKLDSWLTYSQQTQNHIEQNGSDLLCMLGIGLGFHILPILKKIKPKHVIFYETELAVLRASVLANGNDDGVESSRSWAAILEYADQHAISLYFQCEDAASTIFTDIAELKQHVSCDKIVLFKHFDSQLNNTVFELTKTLSWDDLSSITRVTPNLSTIVSDVPSWSANFDPQSWKVCDQSNTLFQRNLAALQSTYPELYQRFKDYQPNDWFAVSNGQHDTNLINRQHLVPFAGDDVKKESALLYENFCQHPSRDGLVVGYRGSKCRHFLHNQFLINTETVMGELSHGIENHPDESKALIMFGLGPGYSFEKLVNNKKIEQLFLFEPNADFFYASLFAIDWTCIFEKIEQDESYLYLNIGDDGSHFSSDMMAHFYRIGPYILNETYLFKGYENQVLNQAIDKLREQLKMMIAMSENFDHSVMGITHSLESIKRSTPFLSRHASKKMSVQQFEVPIFIVGNGPSLDYSIEAIQEYKGQAIIVSCGTALQALHKHNIVPDFHAEIEQYRSTFDWANLIDDLDYLKKVTLISCNGVHPDTCELYKDVLLSFKFGEASTRAIHDVVGNAAFASLETAYPTVSNFALSFFLASGFQNIYLIGTDLGFVDPNHHHSKNSAYYDGSGKETYDYAELHNTGIRTQGNFRQFVSTKTEFDIARMSMEQAFAAHRGTNNYNTSDGAFIKGTSALDIDSILIMSTDVDKQQCLDAYAKCFVTIDNAQFEPAFSHKYDHASLLSAIQQFEEICQQALNSKMDIRALIDEIREYVIAQYEANQASQSSLFFFYFHSLSNSLNALLTKTLTHADDQLSVQTACHVMAECQVILADCKKLCGRAKQRFDSSTSFVWKRESILLSKLLAKHSAGDETLANSNECADMLCLVSDDSSFSALISQVLSADKPSYLAKLSNANIKVSAQPQQRATNILFASTQVAAEKALERICDYMLESDSQAKDNEAQCLLVLFGAYDKWQRVLIDKVADMPVSILLCPPEIDCFEQEAVLAGTRPAFSYTYVIQEAIKRSFDIAKYKLFVYKPVFCKAGLKTAYQDKLDEFSTEACQFIGDQLVPLLHTDHFVNFKTYTAQFAHSTKLDKQIATYTDSLGSRGQYFERQYRASDLLGPWFPIKDIQALY